jgi:lysophospholipase L1-like esterase
MGVKKYIDETALNSAVSSFEEKVVLLTPQSLTEEQKNQVKENLGIGSISSESTSVTTEYVYTYDGDMNSNEWVLNGSGHKMYVRLGDIPKGAINVIGSHVSIVNATNSILNVNFEVTEEHLTRSLSMYDGAMVAEAQQNGFIQILEPIGYYTDPVSALCICTKPGSYIVSFGGWLEWMTFDKTGIYGYETRTWGGNEYCASYAFTATSNNEASGNGASSSPVDYKGNEILAFCRGICIGDSVTEGTLDHSEGTMNKANMSYPAILKRLTGIDIVNAGIAGTTSKTWYETSLDSATSWGDWVNNEWFWRESQGSSLDYSCFDFAIIHLGINDIGSMEEGTSIADVIATFETNINNIVTKLRDNNKGIKIFIATIIPSYASNYNANYKALNEKIIAIADASSDIYLLDLNTFSNLTMHQAYNVWHPTALGYVKLAEEIKALISYTISQNLDDFKDIHLIGTDYTL